MNSLSRLFPSRLKTGTLPTKPILSMAAAAPKAAIDTSNSVLADLGMDSDDEVIDIPIAPKSKGVPPLPPMPAQKAAIEPSNSVLADMGMESGADDTESPRSVDSRAKSTPSKLGVGLSKAPLAKSSLPKVTGSPSGPKPTNGTLSKKPAEAEEKKTTPAVYVASPVVAPILAVVEEKVLEAPMPVAAPAPAVAAMEVDPSEAAEPAEPVAAEEPVAEASAEPAVEVSESKKAKEKKAKAKPVAKEKKVAEKKAEAPAVSVIQASSLRAVRSSLPAPSAVTSALRHKKKQRLGFAPGTLRRFMPIRGVFNTRKGTTNHLNSILIALAKVHIDKAMLYTMHRRQKTMTVRDLTMAAKLVGNMTYYDDMSF